MKQSDAIKKTERLFLRQIDETDTEAVVKLRSDEKIYRFFKKPVKLCADDHIRWYRNVYCKNEECIEWIALDDELGFFVGIYGAMKSDENVVELGYITNPEYKQRGYASEAIIGIIKWCSKKWGTEDFLAIVHEDNKPSIEFVYSLGFEERGNNNEFKIMKLHVREDIDDLHPCRCK